MGTFEDSLTNPREHNPDCFIYLVHGLLNWTRLGEHVDGNSGLTDEDMMTRIGKITDFSKFYRASLIGHLSEQKAKEKKFHYKEVSQLGTFGLVGVILKPAPYAIKISWNSDIGSPEPQEELRKFVGEHPNRFKCPHQLLTETAYPYNEIILQGNPNTEIQGVFYKDFLQGCRNDAERLRDILISSGKRDIPIIALPKTSLPNYDGEDEKTRKELRHLSSLQEQCAIMQAHFEFKNPASYDRVYIWNKRNEN